MKGIIHVLSESNKERRGRVGRIIFQESFHQIFEEIVFRYLLTLIKDKFINSRAYQILSWINMKKTMFRHKVKLLKTKDENLLKAAREKSHTWGKFRISLTSYQK